MTKRIKAFFRKKGADKPIFFAVFVLICLGIVMIGSASIGAVSSKGTAFAIKNMITQSIYVAIGVFIMMVLTNQDVKIVARGFLAICLQHELDHFDGVLYYDHINKEYPLVPIENAMVIE